MPGNSAEDVVTARVNYAQLDRSATSGSLALEQHRQSAHAISAIPKSAAAGRSDLPARRQALHCARQAARCWPATTCMIPYLCPELPACTKSRPCTSLVKTPLVYTSVALRNRQAFDDLKVHRSLCTRRLSHIFPLESACQYRRISKSARLPTIRSCVHMVRTPCKAGLPEHDQNRAGRAELLTHHVRDLRTQHSRSARLAL